MASILNSALTGEANFASTIFNTAPESTEQVTPETKEATQVETDKSNKEQGTKGATTKEKVVEENKVETKKAPTRPESDKTDKKEGEKVAASKEEADKVVKESTEKAEKKSEEKSGDDFPINPHFADKKVADKPEGDDSEKGVASWKEIKSEMKKAREERDRLKAELSAEKEKVGKYEGETVKSLQEEVEKHKTRIAELGRELKIANFERSPEYVEQIKKPLAGLQGDLKAITEANDADFSKLWQAITEPDVRKRTDSLEDLTSDFKRMEQLSIVKMADRYHELAQYHERFQKEAESLAEAEAARRAQSEQEFIENDLRLQKAFTARAWTSAEDRHGFLTEIEGQDDWNTSIRNAKKSAAETNLDRLSVEDRSFILAQASIVPFLESAISHYSEKASRIEAEKDAKIKELETQLEGLVGASPGLGKATQDDSSDDGGVDDSNLTNFGKNVMGR